MTYHPSSTVERITIPGPLIEFGEWGIVLTSSNPVHVGTPKEQLRWTTRWASEPGPTTVSPDIVPLGYFDEHELHLCLGDDLPPTLMARRGAEGDDYHAYQPKAANGQPLTEQSAAIQQAYRRAFALGYGEFLGA